MKIDIQQLLAQLKPADLNDFSTYPFFFKVAGVIVICALILIGGLWFFVHPQVEAYDSAQRQEKSLKNTFLAKDRLAVNLPLYEQQMQTMNQTFGSLLRQLPNSTQVASLLNDITQAGYGCNLTFELFQPRKEEMEDFYAKLPINIRVRGSYHELGQFVSDVAALPRIVTIGNIHIHANAKAGDLTMAAEAFTYRYLTPGEQQKYRRGRRGRRRRR